MTTNRRSVLPSSSSNAWPLTGSGQGCTGGNSNIERGRRSDSPGAPASFPESPASQPVRRKLSGDLCADGREPRRQSKEDQSEWPQEHAKITKEEPSGPEVGRRILRQEHDCREKVRSPA